MANERICDYAADEHADSAEKKGDDSNRSGRRNARVTFRFKVIRHPGHVKPNRIVNAAKAEHHSPDSAETKEAQPLGEWNA
jgi:hypothetical protein